MCWLPFVHILCTHWNFPFYNTCFLLIKKKKSSKVLSLSPLYILDHNQKLQMKGLFNLYAKKASLLKTNLLFSRQTIQKKQRGATLHTFLYFFTTRAPCQEKRTCRTEKGKTHPKPTIAKISSHSIRAYEQCTRRCSMVSSSFSQR